MRRFKKKNLTHFLYFREIKTIIGCTVLDKVFVITRWRIQGFSSAEICPCCMTESEFPSGIGVYMTQNAIQ